MALHRPAVPAALRGGNRMNVVEHTIECSGTDEGIAVVHAIDELNSAMQVVHVRPRPDRTHGIALLMTVPYTNHLVYSNVLARLRSILQRQEVSDEVVKQIFPGRGRICSDNEAEEKYQQFFSPLSAKAAAEPEPEPRTGTMILVHSCRKDNKVDDLHIALKAAGMTLQLQRLIINGHYSRDVELSVSISFTDATQLKASAVRAVSITNSMLRLTKPVVLTREMLEQVVRSAARGPRKSPFDFTAKAAAEPAADSSRVFAWQFNNRTEHVREATLQRVFDNARAKLPGRIQDKLYLTYVSGNLVTIYPVADSVRESANLVYVYLKACFADCRFLRLTRELGDETIVLDSVESLKPALTRITPTIPSRKERLPARRAQAAAEPKDTMRSLPPLRFMLNQFCESGSNRPDEFRRQIVDLLHKHKIVPETAFITAQDETEHYWCVEVVNAKPRAGVPAEAAVRSLLQDLYHRRSEFELDDFTVTDVKNVLADIQHASAHAYTVTIGAAEPHDHVDVRDLTVNDFDKLVEVIKAVNTRTKHVRLADEELDIMFYEHPSILRDRSDDDKVSVSISLGVFTNEAHFQIADFEIVNPTHGKVPEVLVEDSDAMDRTGHGLSLPLLPSFPRSKLPKPAAMNMNDRRTFALSLSKWLGDVAEIYRQHLQAHIDVLRAKQEL